MPLVIAFDKNGKCIKDLSNSHEVFVSMDVDNDSVVATCDDSRANSLDYNTLSRILEQTYTRLHQISIGGPAIISAEYLMFFMSTFNSLHDAIEFGSLVAGITQPDGLRELYLSVTAPKYQDLNNHLLLLLQGIAFASSLEKLHLHFRYRLDVLRPAFIDAIQKNRSLKSLCLDLNWYADDGFLLPEVFQAAAQNNHIEHLTLRISQAWQPSVLKQNVWMPALCQRDCTIKTLCLCGIQLETDSLQVIEQNTSVRQLVIHNGDLSCSDARSLLCLFKSLVSVDLAFNNLRGNLIFDDLLLGEKSTLQSLNLESNDIREGDMGTLIKDLPKLKTIRNLQLNGNPFVQSKACVRAFEKAVLSNSGNLENVQYFRRGFGEKHGLKGFGVNALDTLHSANMEECFERYRDWEKRIMVHLSLNRFGRQHLLEDSSNFLPSNVWPLVLERASSLRYYSMRDEWERPSLESTRADVVYWLLREKVFV